MTEDDVRAVFAVHGPRLTTVDLAAKLRHKVDPADKAMQQVVLQVLKNICVLRPDPATKQKFLMLKNPPAGAAGAAAPAAAAAAPKA